jgi:hypothetical protein
MAIQVYPAPSAGATSSGAQTFTSSGNWTAPAGVTAVTATVVGGGGGGGASGNSTANSNYNFPAGGGAGGVVTTERVPVTPGTTYSVVVGAGGSKGVSTGPDTSFVAASAGGYSSFAANYTIQNVVTNGARELGVGDWLQGEEPFGSSITNPPTYPSGYNGAPTPASTTNRNASPSITNVTGIFTAGSTPWITNNLGNSGYRDLILWVPVTGNTQYILSAYGASNGNTMDGRIRIDWYSSFNSGNLGNMQSTTQSLLTGTSYNRFSATGTSPSNATWALIRLMSAATSPIWTGVLLQTGSTQNDYVGPLTSTAYKTISGVGIISVTSGIINNGGGGGQGARTTTAVDGTGFGGGAAFASSAGSFAVGGNGSGAGTQGSLNIVADRNSIPYIESIASINNAGGGIVSGNRAFRINSTNGGYIIQPNGYSGINGYGAGGMGSRSSNVFPGSPGIGAAAPVSAGTAGGDGLANSGAGGGGGMNTTSSGTSGVSGGNGGSGIVVLSW